MPVAVMPEISTAKLYPPAWSGWITGAAILLARDLGEQHRVAGPVIRVAPGQLLQNLLKHLRRIVMGLAHRRSPGGGPVGSACRNPSAIHIVRRRSGGSVQSFICGSAGWCSRPATDARKGQRQRCSRAAGQGIGPLPHSVDAERFGRPCRAPVPNDGGFEIATLQRFADAGNRADARFLCHRNSAETSRKPLRARAQAEFPLSRE